MLSPKNERLNERKSLVRPSQSLWKGRIRTPPSFKLGHCQPLYLRTARRSTTVSCRKRGRPCEVGLLISREFTSVGKTGAAAAQMPYSSDFGAKVRLDRDYVRY